MLFSTTVFIAWFFPCVLLGYFVLFRRSRPAQNMFLLIVSLFFYAWGEPWFVLVMIASIVFNWVMGLWVDARKRTSRSTVLPIVADLVGNLGVLFVFKYLTFTLDNINALFGANLLIPIIGLPIGISFFTFQAISYVLDVNNGSGDVQRNPFYVGLYISFFPQLIAGPIVKYRTVAAEIEGRVETWEDFTHGVCRFLTGLSKKVLLANQLAVVAKATSGIAGDELSVSMAWLGSIAYCLQLYFDYSGYADMAIGMGRMFGFHFLEDFNYPYISTSISEFWRRWHISMSTWFRDYVYFPLGGSRVKTKRRVLLNLLIVWLCTGIWHGANWTFVVWGLMYYVCLVLEKLTGFPKALPKWVGWLYTMLVLNFTRVIFRADNLSSGVSYCLTMLGLGSGGLWQAETGLYLSQYAVALILGMIFSTPIMKWVEEKSQHLAVAEVGRAIILLALFLICLCYLVKGSYNPFIYFNF